MALLKSIFLHFLSKNYSNLLGLTRKIVERQKSYRFIFECFKIRPKLCKRNVFLAIMTPPSGWRITRRRLETKTSFHFGHLNGTRFGHECHDGLTRKGGDGVCGSRVSPLNERLSARARPWRPAPTLTNGVRFITDTVVKVHCLIKHFQICYLGPFAYAAGAYLKLRRRVTLQFKYSNPSDSGARC